MEGSIEEKIIWQWSVLKIILVTFVINYNFTPFKHTNLGSYQEKGYFSAYFQRYHPDTTKV